MPESESILAGLELPVFTRGPITRQHLVEWCAAENDYYTLHYDERVAATMKLPGTPIQGTYKYALLAQMIHHWAGRGARLQSLSCNYRGHNLEGETLCCHGTVESHDGDMVVLLVWIDGEDGTRTTTGRAVVQLAS